MLGYPGTALAEAAHPFNAAREMGHAPTLLFALFSGTFTRIFSRDYEAANAHIDECVALAEEKGAGYFKVFAAAQRGCVLALTGKASAAVEMISAGMAGFRSTGATVWSTSFLSYLALAYADLGKFDDAWRCISETMTVVETTKEKWFEAELNRIAGEVVLKSPEHDAANAELYFERALTVARQQQAKSWELRAAMSLARLWRDQGKVQQANELLAPVYGWFTEGFDTRDLKEAKALLEVLAS
jgi:predicted ATPase